MAAGSSGRPKRVAPGGIAVNRVLKGIMTLGLCAALLLATGLTVDAQTSSTQQVSDSRMAELLAHAKQVYADGQAQGAAPAAAPATSAPHPLVRLSVEEAVARALEQNIELSVERLNPELQQWTLAQLRAAYTPTLTSQASMSSNMPLPTTLLTGGTRVKNDTLNFNVGISQSLPWNGASYTFQWANPRTDTTSTYATLNPQYTPSMTLTFAQPLLRNFRIDSTRQSLMTSAITKQITSTTLRARVINTEANTRNAYWEFVHSVRAVEAAKQSLALAVKLVEDNAVRVEVGTLAPLDVVQAQAEAATRRQSLAAAEATRITAELTLKRYIVASTADALWNATLEPTSIVQVEPRAVDLTGAVTRALAERTDLSNARKQLESNDISIRYLKNQLKPALDANLTYGTRGLGGDSFVRTNGDVTGVVPGGWKDAMKTLSKFDYPTWTVALNLSYPIGGSSQEASFARAKIQFQQAQAQLRAMELQVATDVTSAALTIESTHKRLEAARAARVLTERKLEAEQSKFEVGMQTNFFVVQAQRDLLDAQITELRASLDYQKALVEFERVQVTSATSTTVTSVTTGGTGTTTATSSTTTR